MCKQQFINIQTKEVLNSDEITKLQDNALLKVRPDLWEQWDFEKNDELGLDIYKATKGSHKYAYWICKDCNHKWRSQIKTRKSGVNCRKCNHGGGVFNITKEQPLTIKDSAPQLVKHLVDKSLADKLYKSSNIKVDWICECGNTVKDYSVSNAYTNGIKCQGCKDGSSYPEKVMYHILRSMNLDFQCQKTFKWSNNKRYDFYVESMNTIIEVHGRQHYEESSRGRSLKEEQENDSYKLNLAISNDIDNYIVIDARNSDIKFILSSILNSELSELLNLDNINEKEIANKAMSNMKVEVLNLWKDGLSVKDIGYLIKLNTRTISKYLKDYHLLGVCNYDPYRGVKYKSKTNRISIYQYDSKANLIRVWRDYVELESKSSYRLSSILPYLKGKNKLHKGCIWSYVPIHNIL